MELNFSAAVAAEREGAAAASSDHWKCIPFLILLIGSEKCYVTLLMKRQEEHLTCFAISNELLSCHS